MPQLPAFPSVFPIWWVAGTAAVGAIVSFVVLRLYERRSASGAQRGQHVISAAAVVGVSILAWRLSGNIPELNDDPIGALSPNDWLCPVVTYVFLSVYGAFKVPTDEARWARERALLTMVSLVVNVITI